MSGITEEQIVEIIHGAHEQHLPPDALGVGDDAAFMPLGGGGVVTSTDMLVENADFSTKWASFVDVGHKALAVNLSDLAAMGSRPVGYLLSLALPPENPESIVRDLAKGLADVASRYNCPLYGGDLSATAGPITINIVVFGDKQGKLLQRGQVFNGENIFIAGSLGGAAAGLHLLQHHPELKDKYPELVRHQLRPEPLLPVGLALAQRRMASAAMDVSDGLGSDLPRFLPPGVGAQIVLDTLPLTAGVREYAAEVGLDPWELALYGGEDYALLFSASSLNEDKVLALAAEYNCPLTKIGQVATGTIKLWHDGAETVLRKGFDHFCQQ